MEALKPFERLDISSLFVQLLHIYSCQAFPILYQVVAGLFALGEPFGEQLGAAARTYVLSNFSSCAQTEPFARWPQKVARFGWFWRVAVGKDGCETGFVALGHHFSREPFCFGHLCNFTHAPAKNNTMSSHFHALQGTISGSIWKFRTTFHQLRWIDKQVFKGQCRRRLHFIKTSFGVSKPANYILIKWFVFTFSITLKEYDMFSWCSVVFFGDISTDTSGDYLCSFCLFLCGISRVFWCRAVLVICSKACVNILFFSFFLACCPFLSTAFPLVVVLMFLFCDLLALISIRCAGTLCIFQCFSSCFLRSFLASLFLLFHPLAIFFVPCELISSYKWSRKRTCCRSSGSSSLWHRFVYKEKCMRRNLAFLNIVTPLHFIRKRAYIEFSRLDIFVFFAECSANHFIRILAASPHFERNMYFCH